MTFIDIGDLPTGFMAYTGLKKICMRPFLVSDLVLIDWGTRTQNIQHILEAVRQCCEQDIGELTDGDFQFLCAWLRLHSYPNTPSQVSWTCRDQFVAYDLNNERYEGPPPDESAMARLGLKHHTCNKKNVEIVHNSSVQVTSLSDDFDGLPEGTDFPRVATLAEQYDILSEDESMESVVEMARWVKEGTTIKDKIKVLEAQTDMVLWNNIIEAQKIGKHGVYERHPLWCRTCDNRLVYEDQFNPFTFFADNKDQDIMDIQYNLMSEFGMTPDDNMPSKKLLYWYSCLAKDKQEAEERRRMQEAVASRR